MHGIRRGSTTSVKEERKLLLIAIEDTFKIAVGKEHATTEEDMRTMAGELFKALEKLGGDLLSAEVGDELGVVDGRDGAIGIDSALDIPRINDLASGGGRGGGLGNGLVREVRLLEGGRLGVGGGHYGVCAMSRRWWRGSLVG